MCIHTSGKFVNGVLVFDDKVPLRENEEVTVWIHRRPKLTEHVQQEVLEMLRRRAANRLRADPEIVRAIAEDPEFNIENW